MRTCDAILLDGRACNDKHKAHGLCARHDQQRRRAERAGREPNFTRRAETPGEDPTRVSPPEPNRELRPAGVVQSNAAAVEQVIERVPEGLRDGWLPVLARSLAVSMDEKPSASTAGELRSVMKEVTALAGTQEVSALAKIRDDLAARRVARGAKAAS